MLFSFRLRGRKFARIAQSSDENKGLRCCFLRVSRKNAVSPGDVGRRRESAQLPGSGSIVRRIAFPLALAVIALAQLSCTRQAAPVRLAVLRFENLGVEAADGWIGRAFQEVLDADLAGAPELYAIPSAKLLAMDRALGARPLAAPGISAGQTAALSAGATRIGYGDYSIRNGRLRAHLSLADPRTGKIVAGYSIEADGGEVVAAATSLARRISLHASAYPTRGAAALHAFIDALEASTPAEAAGRAEAAVLNDPGFSPAARLLAHLRAEAGDRAGALDCLNRALAQAAGWPAPEQGRLRLEIAALGGPASARQHAFAAVAAAEPANPEAWMAAGGFAFSRRDWNAAQAAFEKAADLDPQPAALNQYAYSMAFGGHPDQAVAALRRYQALRPSDPNPLDSLGDVQLLAGHPDQGASFYVQAAKLDPHTLSGGDWLKAAFARLMSGDRAGADALSENFVQARFAPGDPAIEIYRAQWQFLSGRRRQGYRDLEAVTSRAAVGPAHALAAEAHAQLAIWSVYMGDRAAARAHAQAGSGASQAAALAAFLAVPPATPAEWSARAEKLAPRPEQVRARDFALGQALLLDQRFDAALPVLRRAYENATPTDPGPPILLAWAYLSTGQAATAAPLVAGYPIPEPTGIDAFAAGWFPRVFFLRAQAAEKQGQPDVARANYRLFLDLSGDAPFEWGEEAAARASLSGK